ncbi:anaerobic C4-dicarboxylate transporter [Pantoea agglomerans]|uniref:Anaerobic C4-dicarboxylate transporter n=1 Tax=Enterobacter agglomerans TaxID=549 RepID=A0A379ALX5_ENTAG|nr:anaerobic C4-dicarboxylate transporter [Pantoea agglomerans]
MFVVELLIVLMAIWLGARLGGIGIGFAGGMGVLILTLGFWHGTRRYSVRCD